MIQQGPVHESDEHRHGVRHGSIGPAEQQHSAKKVPLHEYNDCDDCLKQESSTE